MKINKDIVKKVDEQKAKERKDRHHKEEKHRKWDDYLRKCVEVGICPKCGADLAYRIDKRKYKCTKCSLRMHECPGINKFGRIGDVFRVMKRKYISFTELLEKED